jgi:hypothetical protein
MIRVSKYCSSAILQDLAWTHMVISQVEVNFKTRQAVILVIDGQISNRSIITVSLDVAWIPDLPGLTDNVSTLGAQATR